MEDRWFTHTQGANTRTDRREMRKPPGSMQTASSGAAWGLPFSHLPAFAIVNSLFVTFLSFASPGPGVLCLACCLESVRGMTRDTFRRYCCCCW
jgi:hypothetical protein